MPLLSLYGDGDRSSSVLSITMVPATEKTVAKINSVQIITHVIFLFIFLFLLFIVFINNMYSLYAVDPIWILHFVVHI